MAKIAIGIDIGGTGIKGALVDVSSGELLSSRVRIETPEGGRPNDIAEVLKVLISQIPGATPDLPVGICFPAVVQHGVTMSAANVSPEWIGLDADSLFTKSLGRPVHVINDADAAGVAEVKFGAGRKQDGLVIMTTLGTGIGTALFLNGKLVPNTELGHLEIDGVDYESKASFAAKEREELGWDTWAERLQKYYSTLERLFSPDLFIIGGGVSKQHDEFVPLLKLRAKVVPAKKRNNAGILGAAALAIRSTKN
ncbi:polyphosphate--glucose phosphotransferase [Rhodoluna limnophila]|uniref:polyphosphate--glucose phosphotransferase n=1 Tax=Rhodoluna limnophila TaxID=232537 RepID=UPI001106ADFE|nr:ROK family protein [Rhodoluna limnophila]